MEQIESHEDRQTVKAILETELLGVDGHIQYKEDHKNQIDWENKELCVEIH